VNRRKILALLGSSPALLAGSAATAAPGRRIAAGTSPTLAAGKITVLNPALPNRLAARYPLAPPLDNLDNKTIYMINLAWEGPDAANYFFGAMREWLAQRYPGIKTVPKVTAEGFFGNDPGIVKEMIANKADGAIVGVAG